MQLARIGACLAAFAAAGPAVAQHTFTVHLDGEQMETPSPGLGTFDVTLDATTGEVSVSGTFAGLIGEVGGIHIHGPAAPFEHAPVKLVYDFTGTTSGTVFGTDFHPGPQEVDDMLCGLYYFVVHTFTYGGGEIRGQIVAAPTATPFGSGVNPPGSLTVLDGTPTIGTTLTLGIDNPTGSQAGPGTAFLYFSTATDPFFALTGAGLPLAGFGMSGAAGELLIDALPPNPILGQPAYGWSGPGQPLPNPLTIPDDKALIGWTAYAQGLLVADGSFGLTNGLELYFGM